jgi:pilus assembly protein TadC
MAPPLDSDEGVGGGSSFAIYADGASSARYPDLYFDGMVLSTYFQVFFLFFFHTFNLNCLPLRSLILSFFWVALVAVYTWAAVSMELVGCERLCKSVEADGMGRCG